MYFYNNLLRLKSKDLSLDFHLGQFKVLNS